MIYDAKIKNDVQQALTRFKWLVAKGKTFELTQKKPIRSLKQNSYLHLILGWFALEYGETLEYVKQEIFKKQVNAEIFHTKRVNKKTGEIRDDWRSTADLDSAETTITIKKFRNYASKEMGIYLPEPDEYEFLQSIEKEMKNHAEWL